jgi:hypothetical protein
VVFQFEIAKGIIVRTMFRIVVVLLGSLTIFAACFYGSMRLQVAYFGIEAYENDAGANFATAASSAIIATVIATIVGIMISDRLNGRRQRNSN